MEDALRLVHSGHAAYTRMFLLERYDERRGLPVGDSERCPAGEQTRRLAYELVREAQEERLACGGAGGDPGGESFGE